MKKLKHYFLILLLCVPLLGFKNPKVSAQEDINAWAQQARVTLIGDSLSVGLRQAGWEQAFPNGTLDAKNSRWLYNGNIDSDLNGLQTLLDLDQQGLLGDILVLNLGTNGGFDAQTLNAYLSYVPSYVQHVALVTTASDVPHRASVNQAILEVASMYQNVSIIDWETYAYQTGWSNYYGGGDGIHLTNYPAYLNYIAYSLYENANHLTSQAPLETAPTPQPYSDKGWRDYKAALLDMNVRALEPSWMTAAWLEELFNQYPNHAFNGTGDIWIEMADKYAINIGVVLGQALKETGWGRVGCPVGQSPYNFGCVVYAPNLAQQFGLTPTDYVRGRQWMNVQDKRTGIELMFYTYDHIAKNLAHSNRYGDILEYYAPSFENDHDTFINFMYGVNAVMMQRDIHEQRVKSYYGGRNNYTNGGLYTPFNALRETRTY